MNITGYDVQGGGTLPGSGWHADTLVELLCRRAQEQPESLAFTFLADGEAEAGRLTYGELDRRARSMAVLLCEQAGPGTRACLFFSPGLDYIVALFACFYAGLIAVPAYPPRSRRRLTRLETLIENPEGVVAVGSPNILALLRPSLESAPEAFRQLRWITEAAPAGLAQAWRPPEIGGDSIAIIQYTSGSTAAARGVILTHRNLLHNLGHVQKRFGLSAGSRGVIWLPPYHDMGLIGGILEPLYAGFDCVLMSPTAFLQRPLRWLQAISHYRATISGGPNFAFDLCARKIPPESRHALDLSSWELAFTGAEPVRHETMERFAQGFAPAGFRRDAFRPCYGLAEATLMVTSGRVLNGTIADTVDAAALGRNRVIRGGTERITTLTGCGDAIDGTSVRIVDPQSLVPLGPDCVGEILVAGPSVAQGYYNRPEETERVFGMGQEGVRYLKTGDLGYLHDGELFVTGRLKDLIIIRGANYYPHDVEAAAEASHPAMRRGCGAAFSVNGQEGERLIVVQEVEAKAEIAVADVAAAVRRAVAEECGLEIGALILLKPGAIPKTSSGKVRRADCREAYLEGRLEIAAEWQSYPAAPPTPKSYDDIERWLTDALSQRLGVPSSEIDPRRPFTDFGLESADAVGLALELESWLGSPVPPMMIWDYPSIESLARHLDEPAATEGEKTAAPLRYRNEPVAVIGMACRLPGADNPEAFWKLLAEGRAVIREAPSDRWGRGAKPADGARWGGFLDGVDQFDPYFFGIAPREAAHMDPQQRLVLEVAWHAFEDAGQAPPALAGSRTGVFIGISNWDYSREQSRAASPLDIYSGAGNAFSIAANRISYTLDLKGPSLSIDTACSSSLTAIHLACHSLLVGESSLALAGGVNLILSPDTGEVFAQARMLAPDGKCKVFDAAADGYVRGEGCGVVVLKRLSDALAAGDRVDGLILSSAVNQDGRTNGLTAPNGPSQRALIRDVLDRAGVTSAEIGYVETHGTGTALGDPIEVQSLAEIFPRGSADELPCWMGSVKANIGHLEPAAGVASLIKALLALRHAAIPAQIHVRNVNPHIALDHARLRIPTDLVPWTANSNRRLALVNSFGFGGSNAALVVAEAPPPNAVEEEDCGLWLFTLSARTEKARLALARAYADRIDAGGMSLGDLCFSANTGRAHFSCRLAAIASSAKELSGWLRSFGHGGAPPELGISTVESAVRREPASPGEDQGRTTLERLRGLYLEGFDIDWAAFHAGNGKHRVALPVYPYERERFWIESRGAALEEPATLRPLLARRIPSALPLFEVRLSAATMPWLTDHTVHGEAIFPAAGYLEMVLEAAAEHFGEGSFELTEIVFERAMFSGSREPLAVQIVFTEGTDRQATFRIFSQAPGAARWVEHARGNVRSVDTPRATACPTPGGAEMDVEAIYRNLHRSGLEYGEAFRNLKRAWRDGGRLSGWVEIHPSLRLVAGDFVIHPALLDSCLHLLAASEVEVRNYLPVSIDRFVWRGGFATAGWVHSAVDAPSGGVFSAGLQMWDEEGRPVLEMAGIRFQSLERPSDAPQSSRGTDLLYELRWERGTPVAEPESISGRWGIVPGKSAIAGKLALGIHNAGGVCEFFPQVADSIPSDLKGVISLLGLDTSPDPATMDVLRECESLTLRTLSLVKSLVAVPCNAVPGLWLVTRAQSTAPVQSCLWGLGRTIALEYPHLRCTLVELDPESPGGAEALFSELAAVDGETQVAYRNGERLVARIAKIESGREALGTHVPAAESYFLNAPVRGNLDALALSPSVRTTPSPGQVEVRVRAAGLNFSDVLKTLGAYPGALKNPTLGAECSGTVERIGQGVTSLRPGDEVMGIAPHAFAPFATTEAALLVRKPANLGFEEAAASPMAFLTAAYSLCRLARIREGETILIHAGAGGVGLAAIQLAQRAGARVFATAGSHEKRTFLESLGLAGVFDSRSLDFAASVLDATGGRGVDVVLNSLAGEAMLRSLDLVAPLGRFVEIGKADIYGNRNLGLTPFQRAISYFAVDLDRMFRERLEVIQDMLSEIAGWLETGTVRPLPLRVFTIQEASEAFRHMAQARHIGKIVISPAAPASPLLRRDALYLITGGFGALGLQTADWMAGAGARHIVLAGRHKPSPFAQVCIAALEQRGVKISAKVADVSDPEHVEQLLAELHGMPPLRGLVHAAGVLADATLAKIDSAMLHSVLAPKISGAWLLHQQTAGMPLDFFVMYSSLASVLGSPGQGAYAAANAFLDGLAHYRASRALPALVLNWGPWRGGGMAARAGFSFDGIMALDPSRAFQQLEALLRNCQNSQVLVAAVDWPQIAARLPHGNQPLFSRVNGEKPQTRGVPTLPFRDGLRAATPERRRADLEKYVLEQVSRVTGIPVERIDRSHNLEDLGIDSLTALELMTSLEETLQVAVSITLVAGDNLNVAALATRILSQLNADEGACSAGSSG